MSFGGRGNKFCEQLLETCGIYNVLGLLQRIRRGFGTMSNALAKSWMEFFRNELKQSKNSIQFSDVEI